MPAFAIDLKAVLITAKRDFTRPHFDPRAVHGFDEPAP
jgi:hypothetical protein